MLNVRFVCVCEAGLKTAVNCHRGQWEFLRACGMPLPSVSQREAFFASVFRRKSVWNHR